jgi:hypothetical protein
LSLAKRVIPIALREGIDTKTSRFNGVVGRLTRLENGVFSKIGEIQKRYGQDRIVAHVENGAAIAEASGLATFRDELLTFGDYGRVYSLSGALDRWLDRGAVVSVAVDERSVVRNTYQQSNPDVARGGSMTLTAYEDTRGGVRATLSDDETGAVLIADQQISASGTRVRVVSFASAFFIFYSAGAGIFYRRIAHNNPTNVETEQNPVAVLESTSAAWDVAITGSRMTLAWLRNAGAGSGVEWWSYDTSLAIAASGSFGVFTTADALSLFSNAAGQLWFAYSRSSAQYVRVLDAGGTSVLGETTIGAVANVVRIAGCVPTNTTAARIVFDTTAPLTYTAACSGAGAVTTASVLLRGVSLLSRPFSYGAEGTAYVAIVFESPLRYQDTAFVVNAATGRVIAKAAPSLAGGARSRNCVSHAPTVSAGNYTLAATIKTALDSDAGGVFTRNGVELIDLDFTGQARYLTAEAGGNLLIAGGVLHAYDGVSVTEHGFNCFPEGITSSVDAGLGTIDAGSHSWRAVYEWTDGQGPVHRSAPSEVETIVTVLNDRVTLTIPTLRLTAKSNVRIAVYRNLAAGAVYYRLGSIASPTLNDPTTDSVTFVDGAADADIRNNEVLYSDGAPGSELEHIAPPASRAICTHRGRVFVVTGRDRVHYSKQIVDGEAVAFNDGLYLLPDARGGELVAVASMDDKLVMFRERAIYFVAGDGPSDTGAGGYPEPMLITSDVGCSEVRSVVLTNAGLMFKSAKGIYMLDRALSVSYLGAAVEDWNGLTITSANVVPNTNEVRFTTTGNVTVDDDRYDAPTLVYDYAFNQWSTFTNYAAADATVWGGGFVRVQSNGRVYKENRTTHSDAGSWITLRLTTTWMSLGGVSGFQRVWHVVLLGAYKSAHSVRLRVGYDFSPGWEHDETIDAEAATGAGTWGSSDTWGSDRYWGGAPGIDWFKGYPGRQKCSSIRLSVQDVQGDASVGEGFTIGNICLLAGVKRGTQKLADTRVF